MEQLSLVSSIYDMAQKQARISYNSSIKTKIGVKNILSQAGGTQLHKRDLPVLKYLSVFVMM